MSSPPQATVSSRGPGRPRLEESADAERGDVRDRLLDAATELAVEQGFETCGLREIAARAEVSPGMIAYYFGDRQGLYEAMFQRAFDRVAEQVRAVRRDPGRSGGDRIDELVRLQVSVIAADPWLPRLILREALASSDSPLRERIGRAAARGPLTMMIQWIEEEQACGVIRADLDPRMLALSIASLAAFPFLVLPLVGDEIGLEPDRDLPERLIVHNQKFLAHGLRARPEEER